MGLVAIADGVVDQVAQGAFERGGADRREDGPGLRDDGSFLARTRILDQI